jgi:TrmH family RNA methyltransferase
MISRQKQKLIKSLQLKKYQKQEQKFLVEGEKSVLEILNSQYKINILLATKRFLDLYRHNISQKYYEIHEVAENELARTGSLKTNKTALVVADIPIDEDVDISSVSILPVFDGLQDPGNLGTIIRTCDWYGHDTIVLSRDSVDFYNPKVIHASMGSFIRVKAVYSDLKEFLENIDIPVYAATIEGENIYDISWPERLIILFGNESRGIHKSLNTYINRAVSIPRFGGAESLNVGVAAAVFLDSFRRKAL